VLLPCHRPCLQFVTFHIPWSCSLIYLHCVLNPAGVDTRDDANPSAQSSVQVADALGDPTPPSSRSPSPGLASSTAQDDYDGAPCPESPPSLAERMQRQTLYYRGQFMAEDISAVDDVPAMPLSAHIKTRAQHGAQAAAARKVKEQQGHLGGRRMSMDTIMESPGSFYTAQEGFDSPGMQSADSGTPMSFQSTGRISDPSPGSAESGNTAGSGATASGATLGLTPGLAPAQQTVVNQPPLHQQHPVKHGLDGTAFAPGTTAVPVAMFDFQPARFAPATATAIDTARSGSDSFSSSWSGNTVELAAASPGTHGATGAATAGAATGAGFGGFAPVSGPQCSPVGFKTYSGRSLDSYAFTSGAHVRKR